MSLNWSMKPVPTIHSAELIGTPSALPTIQTFRQPPRRRIFQEDQLDYFRIYDKINSLDDLNQSHSPHRFEFRQFEGCAIFSIFYRLKFENVSQFPTILEPIRIDGICMSSCNIMVHHFHYRLGSLMVTEQS